MFFYCFNSKNLISTYDNSSGKFFSLLNQINISTYDNSSGKFFSLLNQININNATFGSLRIC